MCAVFLTGCGQKFEGLIIGLINRQGLLERRIKILENALKRSK